MSNEPPAPPPDDKDWTWVLTSACPACGFDASALDRTELPQRTRAAAARMVDALARPDAGDRPAAAVWSPLEYGCHVRDVCRLFAERLEMMRAGDDPRFANWDQDVTARQERYWEQRPDVVAAELAGAAEAIAAAFGSVRAEEWQRPGRRSNGSVFTVESLGRYFLHDLEHHVHDMRG